MIKKLKMRFVLITMSLLFCILVAIFSSVYLLMYNSEKNQSIRAMENMVKQDGPSSRPKPPIFFNKGEPSKVDFPTDNIAMHNSFSVKQNNAGDILQVHFNLWEEEADPEKVQVIINLVNANEASSGIISLDGNQFRFLRHHKPYGTITVFLDRSLEITTLNRLIMVCLIIGSLSFIVLFLITLLLADWAVRPISRAWEKQKQFVADASHELRTPLTVITANTDAVLANPTDLVCHQSKWLDYIKFETERMTKLVNNLLYLAKLDSDEHVTYKTAFNLSEAMTDVCLPFESVVFEEEKTFNLSIEDSLYFTGDQDRMKQLALILLDNALKNTDEKGTIDFILLSDKDKIKLTVTNTGPGIAEEHLTKIFQRFYRVDSSRARQTGGYGLGLSIAKTITEQHGGSIHVTSSLLGPTSFQVTLSHKKKTASL